MTHSELSDSAVVWDTPKGRRIHMSVGQLHQLLWEAAGAGAGAVMAAAPHAEMPTEVINESLARLLDGHGLPRYRS